MGRLPALTRSVLGALLLASAGMTASCENEASKAAARAGSRERSEIVIAKEGALEPKPAAPTASTAQAAPSMPPVPRKVCDGQLGKPGRDLTKRPLARKAALGQKPPPAALSSGQWIWINLWAAWCAPCKEEMPRLASFASRLAKAGQDVTLVFVSLDDDERQLEQFLATATDGLARTTYWLRDGRERDDWLTAMGLPKAPELPVQILIDPRGKVRCTVHGAVEDGDYAEIAGALGVSSRSD